MLRVSQLFIYPIKSLGGVELTSAAVTDRGLELDRRWMLVDNNNRFLSQREFVQMALLKVSLSADGLLVNHAPTNRQILIPFEPQTKQFGEFTIWDDTCTGQYVSADADAWFSNALQHPCRLVYMPNQSKRLVDPEFKYVTQHKITSFSDAYPFLIIGQSSLDDLNQRLEVKLPMDRFRPNIVFTGGQPYAEDTMAQFTIGTVQFTGSKLCARCNIPTINQQTGAVAKEPTRTLAKYRQSKNKVYFGQNLIHNGHGTISIGDIIEVAEVKEMLNSLTPA
ncbi:hypothetical protein BDD43_5065 [Mucilaginibacter gracilis]|uniref:MOSC domain-containing protein n=1 Tax=Mucilaginibacter gracilis TaxID=423350 RepID=A0A495J8M6_9SPHI|nr:MOSC N-terminal beta barrel domain-containing protein [Mucilaginibacter gracilis]RKR84812.1 hypothetical protein BDD43_5065 [Mucilaginibacter gracilis]